MSDGVRKLSVRMWGLYATHQGQPPVDNGRRIADEPPAGVGTFVHFHKWVRRMNRKVSINSVVDDSRLGCGEDKCECSFASVIMII
jgi:hypothetical protein